VRAILKADTNGTLSVLRRELSKIGGDKARLKIIRSGVGDIVPSDVFLADTTKAKILGFGVATHRDVVMRGWDKSKPWAEIKTYDTLQAIVEQARRWLEEIIPPLEVEEQIGRVKVCKIIKSSKLGKIGGGFVTSGVIRRNSQIRLVRDGIILWQGRLTGLRRFKDDAKEVRENFECGVRLAGYDDIQEGDLLEVIEVKKVPVKL